MLRVYLDQNKWIDLARAASGHREGDRFRSALDVCRAAAEAGAASFPLDMYRYWETSQRGENESRNKLADLMIELSRLDSVSLPFPLLDNEIDTALRDRFGRPADSRPAHVFGRGMRHISAGRVQWTEFDVPEGTPVSVAAELRAALDEQVERALLRAGPDTHANVGGDPQSSNHAEKFVEYEVGLAQRIAELGLRGTALNDAIRESDLHDIKVPLVQALRRAEIDSSEFAGLGKDALLDFMDALPTRRVTNVLRRSKHAQLQQPWEPHDFVDVVALPVPAVYCDVVVTEKQWVHQLRTAKIGELYTTTLLSDVAKLGDLLASATRI
ncbi:hypothetical protein [Rhodococcoides fascians]|uniref:hypothetical protein n=1 Tax=Rhodococcoides fascians TaxID=1828 RepID=UPI00050BF2FC|nr:hypothetical protein [Rhodococcus fascians]